MDPQSKDKRFLSTKIIGAALFFLFLFMMILVRCRLLNIPLERDEGEYAYCGQLLLQGIAPYQLAYNMKLPGTYAVYALFMAIFGESTQGIHLGFLCVNIFSTVLIFFISKRLFGFIAGIFSGISYAVLSASFSVLGLQAHATHFVVAMMLVGLWVLLKALEDGKMPLIFLSGLFFGIAFLMKQQGVFFIPFGFYYLSTVHFKGQPTGRSKEAAKQIVFTLGAILPFAATCAALYAAGVFDKFWFWTVQYAPHYSSHWPPQTIFNVFKNELIDLVAPFWPLWAFAFLGIGALYVDARARKHALLVTALFVASFLTVWPGFLFRPHYFVTLLPVVSLLSGCCVGAAYGYIRERRPSGFWKFVPMAVFTVFLACSLYQQRQYLFELGPQEVSRSTYDGEPFVESIAIAKYIKEHSSPRDTIAVLGSEPQIYFYAQRHSATGYIYTYPLMEEQPYAVRMQQEMIHEIETARPRYVVFVNIFTSWVVHPGEGKLILEWAKGYIHTYYTRVGVIDIFSKNRTEYHWGASAQNIRISSPDGILVFRRKD